MTSWPHQSIDRAALRRLLEGVDGGRQWWRSLDELAETPAFRRLLAAEFPHGLEPRFSGGRREFLRLLGASLLLAGLPACTEAPRGPRVPYLSQPEELVPGRPLLYATAVPFAGYAQPVLAVTHMGRPTKLEGNPEHPMSGGATDAMTQAAVLQLYDPDRSRGVQYQGRPVRWEHFRAAMAEHAARWQAGAGLAVLTGDITSPTQIRQLEALGQHYPGMRWYAWEPVGADWQRAAAVLAFGRPLEVHYHLDAAAVAVSLDADLLGPGPQQVHHVRSWSHARRVGRTGNAPPHLHVAESTPSLTGAAAATRRGVPAWRMAAYLYALAGELGLSAPTVDLGPEERDWVSLAASELRARPGAGLLAVGASLAPELQALGYAINHAIGAAGKTVTFTEPIAAAAPAGSLGELAEAMAAGEIDTFVALEANPAYAAPADIPFDTLLERVPLRVHAGLYADETAERCHWHVPLRHALEEWSDARAVDGTLGVVQPAVPPLFGGRSVHEILDALLGAPQIDPHETVRSTWQTLLGQDGFEAIWREVVHDGFLVGSAAAHVTPTLRELDLPPPQTLPDGALEVVFRPEPSVWDGRYANNPWLQELPRPLTKLTWDNAVGLGPRLAADLGVRQGDHVQIEWDGRTLTGPVWILPGQPPGTVLVHLGYGRRRAGRVGDRIGYDAYRLRSHATPWVAAGAIVRAVEGHTELATTQVHHSMEGFDLVRTVTDAQAPARRPEERERQPTLHRDWRYESYAWGMVIDLDLCTGCNACVAACQAENNIPTVGREEVLLGRELHWLRVDRYYAGPLETPENLFMPVPCMHCERAPCEVGCPVNATIHGPEGLNQMVYPRCIGTRTCALYCPYKVRRFNFYEYAATDEASIAAQRNPNVTVRSLGVMEKCTYCVQRISAARIDAKKDQRRIRDGEVQTACQAACPAKAIVFGDLNDPESAVRHAAADPRNYGLLEHLNTVPRTTYLARIARAEDS
jgi:MoCo/4Fe-4S cofactor protein with predicted Tat translocation signal